MSAYADLLARLVVARRFGMKLGLERMRELLDRLGAPDRSLGTVVHIAGTNGKGSTVAMTAALLRGAGRKVATYTSPHLSTLRERVTIDGELASEAEIVAAAARVTTAGGDELTFFEQVTAIAMLVIAQRRADATVLEVGLGGRLDATNVVAAPFAAVTGVALDHEAILGDTLAAIAAEKAGIFKAGQSAFIGVSGEEAAVPVLIDHARAANVRTLRLIDDSDVAAVPKLGLPGAHQRRNAALAIALADAVHGAPCDRSVLEELVHPGRFEIAGDLILDGAHNPHGARALAETLRERGIRPVLVIAVSADKDARAIADALAPHVSAVIATRYQQDRALDPAALAALFPRAETAPDVERAVVRARELGSPVLVAGSLFIVGEARVRFLGAPADPIFVSDPSVRAAST